MCSFSYPYNIPLREIKVVYLFNVTLTQKLI